MSVNTCRPRPSANAPSPSHTHSVAALLSMQQQQQMCACVCGFASLGKVISGVQLFLLLQKGQKPVLVASKKQQNKRKIEKNEWRKNAFPSLK